MFFLVLILLGLFIYYTTVFDRMYLIGQVQRFGEDLVLPAHIRRKESSGRYDIRLFNNQLTFFNYRLVTDDEPSGIMVGLNATKRNLSGVNPYHRESTGFVT